MLAFKFILTGTVGDLMTSAPCSSAMAHHWLKILLALLSLGTLQSFTMVLRQHPTMPERRPIDMMKSRCALELSTTRRDFWNNIIVKTGIATVATTQSILLNACQPVNAKPDCYTDCYKNCKVLAPKDDIYCQESCVEYCNQDDRQDGLSGSVGSEGGEVGILGGSFGTGTVVKGQDVPPSLGKLPGLDFSTESGKKLIGY